MRSASGREPALRMGRDMQYIACFLTSSATQVLLIRLFQLGPTGWVHRGATPWCICL